MKKKLAVAMFGQKRLSREGGIEIVVKELCTRMADAGYGITCYNRSGHHVSGLEFDNTERTEYKGICQKSVPTIEKKAWLPKLFKKRVVVTIHSDRVIIGTTLKEPLFMRVSRA